MNCTQTAPGVLLHHNCGGFEALVLNSLHSAARPGLTFDRGGFQSFIFLVLREHSNDGLNQHDHASLEIVLLAGNITPAEKRQRLSVTKMGMANARYKIPTVYCFKKGK